VAGFSKRTYRMSDRVNSVDARLPANLTAKFGHGRFPVEITIRLCALITNNVNPTGTWNFLMINNML
jgi:hypothetical protein